MLQSKQMQNLLSLISVSSSITYLPTPARTWKSPLIPPPYPSASYSCGTKYILHTDPLSLNFHFQYLGWCQCSNSGFYNNLLTLLHQPLLSIRLHKQQSDLSKVQIISITRYCPQNKILCMTPIVFYTSFPDNILDALRSKREWVLSSPTLTSPTRANINQGPRIQWSGMGSGKGLKKCGSRHKAKAGLGSQTGSTTALLKRVRGALESGSRN